MDSKMYIAIYSPDETQAAVCVYGSYGSLTEARSAVQELVSTNDTTETDAFIIDRSFRWLVVCPADPGLAEEEEEIATVENNDETSNKMGSVCDLRHKGAINQKQSFLSSTSKREKPLNKTKEVKSQKQQLDDLLRPNSDERIPQTEAEYSELRNRFALLHAFEKKLCRLYEESLRQVFKAEEEIKTIDIRNPEFKNLYKANYEKALSESGIKADANGLMKFLR